MPTKNHIPLQSVTSKIISGIGYEPHTKTLAIQFISVLPKGTPKTVIPPRPIYHYANVPPANWDAFRTSASKGQHFHRLIKGRYQATPIK